MFLQILIKKLFILLLIITLIIIVWRFRFYEKAYTLLGTEIKVR